MTKKNKTVEIAFHSSLSFYLLECMVKPCALIHRSMISQVKSDGHPIVKNLSWLVTPFAASNRPTSAFSRLPFLSFYPKTKLGNLALTLIIGGKTQQLLSK